MRHTRLRHAATVRAGQNRAGKSTLMSGPTDKLAAENRAWVYVGVSRRGLVKVGMSGDPERRCAGLHLRLHFAQEVVAAAAKDVEAEALRLLRRRQGDGEYGRFSADEAVAAVCRAYEAVARYRRVDPDLTEEEARLRRIGVAEPDRMPYIALEPESRSSEPGGGCMGERSILLWHAAIVEPGAHRLAPQSLLEAGFQVLDPKVREAVRLPTGRHGTVIRPMWPGYVLMGRRPDQDWSPVYSARGLGGIIVAVGGRYEPAVVSPALVEWLMRSMSASGIVEGKTASGKQISVPEVLPAMEQGAMARVMSGPFAGLDGVCLWSSMERVSLLLSVLGRNLKVSIRRDQVQPL